MSRSIKLIVVFLIIFLEVMLSTTYGKENNIPLSTKDPGVINQQQIIYWLTKRGKLPANATDEQKSIALNKYLEMSKNGGYQLPVNLAKYDAAIAKKIATSKIVNKLQPVQTKAAVNKDVKILAVLIDFPDLTYDNNRLTVSDTNMYYNDYNKAHYDGLIFSTNGYAGPSGQNLTSAYQYYQSESGGTLFLEGQVEGWVTADNDAAFYGANDPDDDDNDVDVQSLVKEAVTKAVALGNINLADFDKEDQFDLDGDGITAEPDGIIDHVMIYHSSVGEEAGGGVLGNDGADAIWSHRSFVDPSVRGYQIPGTNFKVMGYTIEPIDSAIGVVVHEFGHDLGVADEYNTNSSLTADRSPVGYWSLMASGSWAGSFPGTEPSSFSPLASDFFQRRFDGNWTKTTTYTLAELSAVSQLVTLAESVDHQAVTNLLKVIVPGPLLDFFSPFSGTFQYYSGNGDMKNNSMSFDLTIPNTTALELQMKAHWEIEADYDYARVLINGVAIEGNHTKVNNQYFANVQNFLTNDSIDIVGSTGTEGWVDLTFDMSAFNNQTVTVTIEYVTDQSVGGYGLLIDDINLMADTSSIYFDGAEADPVPVTLAGFNQIDSSKPAVEQNYWVQMKSHNGNKSDAGLASENYESGMLVWFEDPNYTENHVDVHPGHGFIGVVDARQVILSSGLSPLSATQQVRDATFSLYGIADSSIFDDSDDYTTPEQPSSGQILPRNGLSFSLQSQDLDSASASILLSVNPIAWLADFVQSKTFRTVIFTNQSNGTGNASASWDFGDGSALSTEWEPTHTYGTSGDFDVTLIVTTESDSSTDVVTKTVSIAELLTASFQATDNNGNVSFIPSLSGGESAYIHNWDYGDGRTTTLTHSNPHTHLYLDSGSYTVVYTITSADNQTVSSSSTVEVYIIPVALFNSTINNLVVSFTDTSVGGDGNLNYNWDFGDGSSSTEISPSHTYASAGTYTVILTITDGRSNSDTHSSSITVSEPPPPPPPQKSSGGGGSTGLLLFGLLSVGRFFRRS